MKPEELAKAKRAAQRLFCQAALDHKHTMRAFVLDGSRLANKCIKCGYISQTKGLQ